MYVYIHINMKNPLTVYDTEIPQNSGVHPSGHVLISDLAKLVGMSVRQFNRRFKEAFNTTPQSFFIRTRIQAACNEIRNTERSNSELAQSLGFYDQSSFTQHFRKHVGVGHPGIEEKQSASVVEQTVRDLSDVQLGSKLVPGPYPA